jgi:hypothetical protein
MYSYYHLFWLIIGIVGLPQLIVGNPPPRNIQELAANIFSDLWAMYFVWHVLDHWDEPLFFGAT